MDADRRARIAGHRTMDVAGGFAQTGHLPLLIFAAIAVWTIAIALGIMAWLFLPRNEPPPPPSGKARRRRRAT